MSLIVLVCTTDNKHSTKSHLFKLIYGRSNEVFYTTTVMQFCKMLIKKNDLSRMKSKNPHYQSFMLSTLSLSKIAGHT